MGTGFETWAASHIVEGNNTTLMGHFTLLCLVTWPLSGSEAGGDLVLIQTLLLSHVNHVVLMLTSLHLHMKSRRVCIKTRSPRASLPLKGQVTRHTTVKWPITPELVHRRTVSKHPLLKLSLVFQSQFYYKPSPRK